LPDSGVIHKGRVDHRGRLPVILPLTGDVYRMSVSRGVYVMADSCTKEKTLICVLADLHVKLSSQSTLFTAALRLSAGGSMFARTDNQGNGAERKVPVIRHIVKFS